MVQSKSKNQFIRTKTHKVHRLKESTTPNITGACSAVLPKASPCEAYFETTRPKQGLLIFQELRSLYKSHVIISLVGAEYD